MKRLVLAFILLSTSALLSGSAVQMTFAEPTPAEIIEKSIAYHDPQGVWGQGQVELDVKTIYSPEFAKKRGVTDSTVRLWLSPAQETFRYVKDTGKDLIDYSVKLGKGKVSVNGKTDISEEDKERLRIAEPALYRDYFEYLYVMPQKLNDPGTRISPEAKTMTFNGTETLALRVTYEAEVGEDTWDFFFDTETYALVGYRFFHDESKNDGEYIAFSGEIRDEASGLRLPKERAWYYNADDGHLATDDIVSMRVTTP